MLKIIASLFKGVGLNTIAIVVLAGSCLYFGWSYHNRGQKVKDLTTKLELSDLKVKAEKRVSDSLSKYTLFLSARLKEDSVYNHKMILDFQSIIKQVRDAKLQADKERDQALAGVLCYKVTLFGKKKLVNCAEL